MTRGRSNSRLVDGIQKQCAAVRELLAANRMKRVPVTGVLCFVDSDSVTADIICGIHILDPATLIATINENRTGKADIERIAKLLNNHFPTA